MRPIDEAIKPFCLNGIVGLCNLFNQSPITWSKMKSSKWWYCPLMVLDTTRTNRGVKAQLTGSHLRQCRVNVDGYKADCLEVILNGTNTFLFQASDFPAVKGHYVVFRSPKGDKTIM